MPGRDGTGPLGAGPMTGRGLGYCADKVAPGWTAGRGGRGWRNRFYATGLPGWQRAAAYGAPWMAVAPTAGIQELDMLKNQAAQLAEALESIKRRIETLETRSAG